VTTLVEQETNTLTHALNLVLLLGYNIGIVSKYKIINALFVGVEFYAVGKWAL
jgi:hypothetical protein